MAIAKLFLLHANARKLEWQLQSFLRCMQTQQTRSTFYILNDVYLQNSVLRRKIISSLIDVSL